MRTIIHTWKCDSCNKKVKYKEPFSEYQLRGRINLSLIPSQNGDTKQFDFCNLACLNSWAVVQLTKQVFDEKDNKKDNKKDNNLIGFYYPPTESLSGAIV